jgi:hypothetical protein
VGRQRQKQLVPVAPEAGSTGVVRSEVDPDYDCVPVGAGDATAAPPPGGLPDRAGTRLCPEGYVPRRRKAPYRLEGKRIVGGGASPAGTDEAGSAGEDGTVNPAGPP